MNARTQAVLIGGAFMGVLSALPVVSMANCCCLWVIGGGVVAAYLLQQGEPAPIEIGDGALVGVLSGVVGAVIYTIIAIPIQMAMGPLQEQMLDVMRGNADVPPEVLEMMEGMGTAGPIAIIIGFVFMLILGAVFSTLGGILGAVIFKKDTPPAAPLPPSPPPVVG